MRAIKFRVWDKKLKEMHDSIRLCDITEDAYWYDGETDNWSVFYDGCNEQEQFVVMQFTGLYDKNGKEIYEGDIIEIEADGLGGTAIGEIVYDEYDLAFELRNETEELSECLWYAKQQIEVIGNIYDNKDLLEEKKANEMSKKI